MARSVATEEDSLAAKRERSRFGIAMAAITRMMATTIRNSISEKPAFLFLKRMEAPLPEQAPLAVDTSSFLEPITSPLCTLVERTGGKILGGGSLLQHPVERKGRRKMRKARES